MDRDKAIIPDLQISFLDSIAIPVYRYVLVDHKIIAKFEVVTCIMKYSSACCQSFCLRQRKSLKQPRIIASSGTLLMKR